MRVADNSAMQGVLQLHRLLGRGEYCCCIAYAGSGWVLKHPLDSTWFGSDWAREPLSSPPPFLMTHRLRLHRGHCGTGGLDCVPGRAEAGRVSKRRLTSHLNSASTFSLTQHGMQWA